MPRVNPEVLRWARETADLSLKEAARKLGFRDSTTRTAVERLQALEAGKETPSRSVLRRMSDSYRRPLISFYLPEPPQVGDRGEDFRTLPEDYAEEEEALLDALLRDVVVRQSLVRAALEDEDEGEPLPWVDSVRIEDGIGRAVSTLEHTLGINRGDFRSQGTATAAFDLLRAHAEAAGTFVLLMGNLGSYHTQLDIEVFRGFALADPYAPFIIINDQDARAAWSFTLLHEFVHLLVGVTAVSAGRPELRIEQFCNDVASQFLVPERDLSDLIETLPQDPEGITETLNEFSARWNVSRSLLAYRLFARDRITRSLWSNLSSQFREEWLQQKARQRKAARETKGGPSFYTVRRHRVGDRLIEVTSRMMYAGALTTTKAGQVLGVSAKQVEPMIARSPVRPV